MRMELIQTKRANALVATDLHEAFVKFRIWKLSLSMIPLEEQGNAEIDCQNAGMEAWAIRIKMRSLSTAFGSPAPRRRYFAMVMASAWAFE